LGVWGWTRRNALCEDAQSSARALLPHQVHLFLVAVVDLEFGGGTGGLGDQFAFADTTGVCEELFLEVFGDPALDDNVVAIALEGKRFMVSN
jgi:hypothetical protein